METNEQCPQKGHRCPICKEVSKSIQSTVHGYLTCLNCGYCDLEQVFKEIELSEAEAPNRYVLNVQEPMSHALYKQLGVSIQRTRFIMDKIVKYDKQQDKVMNIVSSGLILKEVALWCESPEELILMAVMFRIYIVKVSIPASLGNIN